MANEGRTIGGTRMMDGSEATRCVKTMRIRRTGRRFAAAALGFLICATAVFASGDVEGGTYLGVASVDIDTSFLSFEIRGSASRVVNVEVGRLASNVDVQIDQRGNGLDIRVTRRFSPFAWRRSDPIVVTVPRDVELEVDARSASVSISHISSDSIRVNTESGSVRAEDLDGVIRLSASSGSVRLQGAAGSADVSTSSGSITITGFDGDIDAAASSGSVKVSDATGRMVAKTSSGSIRLEDFRATGNCTFESSSGSIYADFLNPKAALRFELQASSGSIRAFEQRASRTLMVGGGDIVISGKSKSGSQRYE